MSGLERGGPSLSEMRVKKGEPKMKKFSDFFSSFESDFGQEDDDADFDSPDLNEREMFLTRFRPLLKDTEFSMELSKLHNVLNHVKELSSLSSLMLAEIQGKRLRTLDRMRINVEIDGQLRILADYVVSLQKSKEKMNAHMEGVVKKNPSDQKISDILLEHGKLCELVKSGKLKAFAPSISPDAQNLVSRFKDMVNTELSLDGAEWTSVVEDQFRSLSALNTEVGRSFKKGEISPLDKQLIDVQISGKLLVLANYVNQIGR